MGFTHPRLLPSVGDPQVSGFEIQCSFCKIMKAASGGSETQEIGPVFLVGRGGVGGGAL